MSLANITKKEEAKKVSVDRGIIFFRVKSNAFPFSVRFVNGSKFFILTACEKDGFHLSVGGSAHDLFKGGNFGFDFINLDALSLRI